MADMAMPRSAATGIVWPGLPAGADGLVFALMAQLEQSQWWPADTLLRHQLRQLEALLEHAAATVPFYRERLRPLAGIRRGGLTLEAYRRIPPLRREDLQESGDTLVSRRLPKSHGKISEVRSSGSTGQPVSVSVTSITALFTRALNLRFHLWHRRDLAAKVGIVIGLRSASSIEAARSGKGLQWAPGFHSGPMVYFDIMRPVPEQLDWLMRENPEYLVTYPTNLRALLEHAEEIGARPPRLREASLMAEMVDPGLPALCERIWGLPVVATYSAQETGIVALQCPGHTHYHVQGESVFAEVLDDAGEPCAPGEIGRLVVTDLHNFATPLIRYEIGDYAEVGGPCACGRGLPVLARVVGRVRNMLVLPSGEKVWPLAFIARTIAPFETIRQIQLVQRNLDEIDVKLVAPAPLDARTEARLGDSFSEALRHPFRFNFVYVERIPRSPGGKYEDFVSEVAP